MAFGLNESNVAVHITDVNRGKKCNCICPSCRSPLVAAKGLKKKHHFKHAVVNECESGLESGIHLAAKKLILERGQVTLPRYILEASAEDSKAKKYFKEKNIVEDGTVIQFDSVQEEVELYGMRADLLAKKDGKPLIIEIFYRHKVEGQKLSKIVKANISAVEINLSQLTQEDLVDWEAFWSYINDPQHVQWLYNVKTHSYARELEKQLAHEIQVKEEQYKQERIKREWTQKRAKEQLPKALEELKVLSSQESILRIKMEAKAHPFWRDKARYLTFYWEELPDFVNVDVPDGDWIFGCDRRIWQTAFYNSFVDYKFGTSFCIECVDKWLQNKVGCKVPQCVKNLGFCRKHCPNLIEADICNNFPSSWKTLKKYFWHLCDLGILEFTGEDYRKPGNEWFRPVSKNPKKKSFPSAMTNTLIEYEVY